MKHSDQLNKILGNKPPTRPTILVDSSQVQLPTAVTAVPATEQEPLACKDADVQSGDNPTHAAEGDQSNSAGAAECQA